MAADGLRLFMDAICSKESKKAEKVIHTVDNRVSQYVKHFWFFNFFTIRQAHLCPDVPKQAYFRESLQNLQAEIENLANFFLQDSVQKWFKIESPFFADMLFNPSTLKRKVIHAYL